MKKRNEDSERYRLIDSQPKCLIAKTSKHKVERKFDEENHLSPAMPHYSSF